MTIMRLFRNYKPLAFFGTIAALLLLLSLGLFIPVFREYLATGLVPRIPTLIVSGFIAIASLLSFFCGLLLDTINQKNRQDFEFMLQQVAQLKKWKN